MNREGCPGQTTGFDPVVSRGARGDMVCDLKKGTGRWPRNAAGKTYLCALRHRRALASVT